MILSLLILTMQDFLVSSINCFSELSLNLIFEMRKKLSEKFGNVLHTKLIEIRYPSLDLRNVLAFE